jgi:hypothetical protein
MRRRTAVLWLLATILWLTPGRLALASAFTSKAAGNWSSGGQTTWNEVGVPGNGDTVTLNHNITVDTNTTIGASPGAANAVQAILLNGNTLTVNAGVTLRIRGDYKMSNASSRMTMNAGSGVIFDATQAAAPTTTQYQLILSVVNGPQITVNGTSGSHCTWSSDTTGGAAVAYTSGGAFGRQGFLTASYLDASNYGDSGHASMYYFGDAAGNCTWDHVTLNNCGGCTLSATNTTTGSLAVTNCVWSNTLGSNCITITSANAASGGATRTLQNCYMDKGLSFTNANCPRDWNITGNVLPNIGGTSSTNLQWAGFSNNVSIDTSTATATVNFVAAGNVSNSYILTNGAANPHPITNPVGYSMTISGTIFEDYNTSNDGQGDCFIPFANVPTVAVVNRMQNCLILPTQGMVHSCGVLFTHNSASVNCSFSADHNTVCVGGQPGASLMETNNTLAGSITSIRGNGFWAQSTGNYKTYYSTNTTSGGNQDVVSPTNCDFNACGSTVGLFHVEKPSVYLSNTYSFAGNGYQQNQSAYAGANDVNNVNPLYLDPTRNYGTFYTGRLGNATTGTYAGDVAGTSTWISQAAQTTADNVGTRISTVWNWVYVGFTPREPRWGITYSGDTSGINTIGAMNGLWQRRGSSGRISVRMAGG